MSASESVGERFNFGMDCKVISDTLQRGIPDKTPPGQNPTRTKPHPDKSPPGQNPILSKTNPDPNTLALNDMGFCPGWVLSGWGFVRLPSASYLNLPAASPMS